MSLHPILVHFPIALLVTGVGFEVAALLLKRDHLHRPAQYMLVVGLIGAIAAWLTGPLAAERAERLLPGEKAIYVHRAFATLTVILFGALIALRSRLSGGKAPVAYLGLAALGLFTLLLTGRTGGEMVYGERGMIATQAGDRFQRLTGGEEGEGLFQEGLERRGGEGAPGEAGEGGVLGGREAGETGEARERGGR